MNTLTNLPPEVASQYCMRMLSRPMPDLIADVGNYHVSMEQNQGNVLIQSRYDNLPTQPVPLGPSGINPAAMVLNRLDVPSELSFFGGYVAITEQVLLINQDRALEETLDLLSQSAKETDDQLIREHLVNNAPFTNCVHGTINADNPTELTRQDLSDVVKTLRGNNAKYIMEWLDGADKFNTSPIRNAYWAKTSTDMIGQLENVDGFISVANYAIKDGVADAEYCAIGNVRFLLSSVWPVSANASALAQNVENIIVQGQEAASVIELDGYSTQYRYTPPRVAGGPLWLYGTSGYVFAQVPQITNTTWINNLRCTLVV